MNILDKTRERRWASELHAARRCTTETVRRIAVDPRTTALGREVAEVVLRERGEGLMPRTPEGDPRVGYVAALITGLWPHRQSFMAARIILDHFDAGNLGQPQGQVETEGKHRAPYRPYADGPGRPAAFYPPKHRAPVL